MSTTNKNFTVEGLVAKYRNFVNEHCPQIADECGPMPIDDDAEEQLLVMLYSRVAGENADKRILEALSKYGNDFYLAALTDEEITFLVNHFSEVSSSIFDFFSDESNGKKWNYGFERPSQRTIDFLEFDPRWWNYSKNHTSDELQKEMQKFDIQSGMTIFIANSGYCDIAMLFPGCTIKGFTHHRDNRMDKIVWALGQIRLYAAGIKSEIVPCREDIEDWQYMADVDFAIWGTSYHSSYEGIEQFFEHMKPNSKLLIFMDKDDAAGNTRYESKDLLCLRRRLVKEKNVSTIVSFEEFDNYIEINRHRICVFADKAKNDTVIVKNSCSGQEIELSSHMLDAEILWPSYYIALKPKDGIALSEIVSFHDLGRKWEKDIDRELIIERKNGDWILSENAIKMPVVAPVDMAYEYKNANLCEVQLKLAGDPIYDQWIGWLRKIEEPCILLFGKKEKFVVGYINQLPEEGMATLDTVVCLIPKKGIDVRYVAALLLTPEVKNQIMSICEGIVNDSTFPLVINKVIVPNHNDKERLAFLSEVNYAALINTKKEMQKMHQQEVDELNKKHMDKLCNYQHGMRKPIREIGSAVRRMERYVRESDMNVEIKDYLLQRICHIKNQKVHLSEDIERLNEENTYDEATVFDIDHCLRSFLDYFGKDIDLKYENVIAERAVNQYQKSKEYNNLKENEKRAVFERKKDELSKIYVDIAEYNFKKIVKRILDNAEDHGFSNSLRNDCTIEIILDWDADINMYRIDIRNNGNPLPEGLTKENYGEYKKYGGLTGKSGIGGYEVAENIKHYGGDFALIQDNDWVVISIFLPKSRAYERL